MQVHDILIRFSWKFVSTGSGDDKFVLVLVMAWFWTGDKPLLKKMLTNIPDNIWHHKVTMS